MKTYITSQKNAYVEKCKKVNLNPCNDEMLKQHESSLYVLATEGNKIFMVETRSICNLIWKSNQRIVAIKTSTTGKITSLHIFKTLFKAEELLLLQTTKNVFIKQTFSLDGS